MQVDMDPYTKADLKVFLREMQVITQVTFSDEDKKTLFTAWTDALEDLSLVYFERAKKELLKEWKYAKFPKPSDLLNTKALAEWKRSKESPYKSIEKKKLTPKEIEEKKEADKAAQEARDRFFKKQKELA